MGLHCSGLSSPALALCFAASLCAQQSTVPAGPEQKSKAVSAAASTTGRIKLNVVVTDQSGKPVSGLGPGDVSLLDNNQRTRILSFEALDGLTAKPNPPVKVILLVDMVNIPFIQVAFVRQQIEEYLRENGGHLAHPVSIYLLTDQGVGAQSSPPSDGNALASDLHRAATGLHTTGRASQGLQGAYEVFILSTRALTNIAAYEAKKPGRKVLIWPGPGWPIFDWGAISPKSKHAEMFNSIVTFSTALREAGIELCAMVQFDSRGVASYRFKDFLKGAKSVDQANPGDLDVKVLAIQSGGRVLDPSNDLTKQIEACAADAGPFYTISFDAPRAGHPNEYHDLKVLVDKPNLTARTNTGYYDQP
jgi:VWFA-related protein